MVLSSVPEQTMHVYHNGIPTVTCATVGPLTTLQRIIPAQVLAIVLFQ